MAAICVYCASSPAIAPGYVELAAEVGRRLAAEGHSLVWGGGSESMMGAVARAARAGGAHTFGVIPRQLTALEGSDTAASELAVVDTMRERKRLMDEAADAFLALPGGIGTFEELLEVWTSRYLEMHHKPVIVLDAAGFYAPLWAWVEQMCEQGFVRPAAMAAVHRAESVEQAFGLLASLLPGQSR